MRHCLPALLVIVPIMAFIAPSMSKADTPGRHPLYLHARSDLRSAQLILRGFSEPNVREHVRKGDEEIERAIGEIDRAAVLDRKHVEDHPHVDSNLDRYGRFRNAMKLLEAARRDLGREEDNPAAIGWRNEAFRHIDEAMNQLHRAARDLRWDHELGW
jgi:hypothetical protein